MIYTGQYWRIVPRKGSPWVARITRHSFNGLRK